MKDMGGADITNQLQQFVEPLYGRLKYLEGYVGESANTQVDANDVIGVNGE